MRRTVSAVLGFGLGLGLALAAAGTAARAGEAEVFDVKTYPEGENTWRFEVTVRHGDTGWDHYADKWEVVAPDGTVLGTRELAHPHVDEQPFTRSLGGVKIPEHIEQVTIRAHDNVHGYGGAEYPLSLTR